MVYIDLQYSEKKNYINNCIALQLYKHRVIRGDDCKVANVSLSPCTVLNRYTYLKIKKKIVNMRFYTVLDIDYYILKVNGEKNSLNQPVQNYIN